MRVINRSNDSLFSRTKVVLEDVSKVSLPHQPRRTREDLRVGNVSIEEEAKPSNVRNEGQVGARTRIAVGRIFLHLSLLYRVRDRRARLRTRGLRSRDNENRQLKEQVAGRPSKPT